MPLRLNSSMPELTGITEWVHGTPEIKPGQPLLIYFWAVSCHICHENMPHLAAWREKFVPLGLQMVAIHAPRQPEDTELQKVYEQIEEFQMREVCGIDNQHILMNRFENQFWPAYFLYDGEGKLRRRTAGNAGLSMLEPILEQLVNESQTQ